MECEESGYRTDCHCLFFTLGFRVRSCVGMCVYVCKVQLLLSGGQMAASSSDPHVSNSGPSVPASPLVPQYPALTGPCLPSELKSFLIFETQ